MRAKTGTYTLLALAGTAIATLAVLGGSQGTGSEAGTAATTPVGAAFTYQRRQTDGFDLVNSECDLQFSLWDAGALGTQMGKVSFPCLLIEDGLVIVDLDFGLEAFDGNERWLQIEVRCPCDPSDMDPFNLLTPRQLVTATPYTFHALDSERLGGVLADGYLQNLDGVIQRNHIAMDAVGTDQIQRNSINSSKIAPGSIMRDDLGAGSVGNSQIQMNAIDGNQIMVGSITRSHLSPDSVGSSQLQRDAASLSKVSGNVMNSTGGDIEIGTVRTGAQVDIWGPTNGPALRIRREGAGNENGYLRLRPNTLEIAGDAFLQLHSGSQTVQFIEPSGPWQNLFAQSYRAFGDVIAEESALIGAESGFDGRLTVRTPGTGDILNLYDGGTNVFAVVDGGNVGIGDSSPNALLHLNTGSTGEDGFRVQINGSTKLIVNENGSVSIGTTLDGPDRGLYVQGSVGIGNPAPGARLHVQGQGSDPFPNADHIAIFENTGGASPDGIAIKLNASFPDSNNRFLTFYDSAGNVRGRVEGVDGGDILADFLELPGVPQLAGFAGGVAACLGGGFPNTAAEVTAFLACVNQNIPAGTDVCVISDYNVMGAVGLDPLSITAGLAGVAATALCKFGGVTYASHGADYAEWLPKLDPTERFFVGEVVGVHGGRISKTTDGADQIMSISVAPVVVGNLPPEGEEDNYAKVGFMGQVPVWVRREVDIGDYIVPSGENDGVGVAVSPQDLRAEDLDQIVGRAWSSSENSGLGLVNLLIGVKTNEGAQIAKRQAKRIEELEERVESLTTQLGLVNDLSLRLAEVERLVAPNTEAMALAGAAANHEETAQ